MYSPDTKPEEKMRNSTLGAKLLNISPTLFVSDPIIINVRRLRKSDKTYKTKAPGEKKERRNILLTRKKQLLKEVL